jgi:hypothetical protein
MNHRCRTYARILQTAPRSFGSEQCHRSRDATQCQLDYDGSAERVTIENDPFRMEAEHAHKVVPSRHRIFVSVRLKGATLKVYKGAPHGMCTTLKDQVNEDLLTFSKG